MFALVDGNNFYVSCQQLFDLRLRDRPVVVLSNNDGCVVSRSQQAKDIGIKMGVPISKVEHLVRHYNVAVLSSNYELYGDMSSRMMDILSRFSPSQETYSIDECFLDFSGIKPANLVDQGKIIVRTTKKNIGIPVCVGFAPTKTLAKLANKFAKKYPAYQGVAMIDTDEKRQKALHLTAIGDVWGIGERYAGKLQGMKVNTAYDFTQLPKRWVRKNMSIVGERIWRELQGESCLQLETIQPDRKQVCASRSLGQVCTAFDSLMAAIAEFTGKCAYRLRNQQSCATKMHIGIATDCFRKDAPQYSNSISVLLPVPTANTIEILPHARAALLSIYRPGYEYKRAEVIVTGVTPSNGIQGNLFHQVQNREAINRLTATVDTLNSRFGRDRVLPASVNPMGIHRTRHDKKSPCYSTRITDIIDVYLK